MIIATRVSFLVLTLGEPFIVYIVRDVFPEQRQEEEEERVWPTRIDHWAAP